MVTRCAGSCIELADSDRVVPEFVIPSRCAARVSFKVDMLDDLKGGILSAEMFCVLYVMEIWGCSPCQLETMSVQWLLNALCEILAGFEMTFDGEGNSDNVG